MGSGKNDSLPYYISIERSSWTQTHTHSLTHSRVSAQLMNQNQWLERGTYPRVCLKDFKEKEEVSRSGKWDHWTQKLAIFNWWDIVLALASLIILSIKWHFEAMWCVASTTVYTTLLSLIVHIHTHTHTLFRHHDFHETRGKIYPVCSYDCKMLHKKTLSVSHHRSTHTLCDEGIHANTQTHFKIENKISWPLDWPHICVVQWNVYIRD